MKLEIISEKDNPLRKRKEYWLSADHADKETPSRHDLLPEVAKKLGSKEELIVLDKIFSERGAAKSRVKVQVYNDKKEVPKEKLERQERKVKEFLEKKEAAKEKPAAAPAEGKAAEEAPAEEKKEEEAPSEEQPSEEATVEEKPAEEQPAEEKTDETPAEEAPPEEKKEEKPAEEPKEEAPSEETKEEEKKK